MDLILGRPNLHQYTGDTLNFCYSQLGEMVGDRKGMLPVGTMPADKIQFYKELLTTLQGTFKSISESNELASPYIPKVIQKLALVPKYGDIFNRSGEGAAWLKYAYTTHKKSIKGELQDEILSKFASPFAARERSPTYGYFSPNPFGKFPLEEVQRRYSNDLKSIKTTVLEKDFKVPNAEYWKGLLKALEKALQPITSNLFCYHLHLLEILRMLAQVPELAETLSKCHIASLIVFERLSEFDTKEPVSDISLGYNSSVTDYLPSPLKTGHRQSSMEGILEGSTSLDKRINTLGTMLEAHIAGQPSALQALEGRISEQVKTLADSLKESANQTEVPQLKEALERLTELAKLIKQEQSDRKESDRSTLSLEPLEKAIAEILEKVSERHNSLLKVLKTQEEVLKEQVAPLAKRVEQLETSIAEVSSNVLSVLKYLEQANQRTKEENVNLHMQAIETSLGTITQQIGSLNLPAKDTNEPRFQVIQNSLAQISANIQTLRAAQHPFVDIEEVQQEDPVLTRLGILEELVTGLANSIKNIRPRQSSSNSSYQGQPNTQGQTERERLVGNGNPNPPDDTCCNIL